MTRFLALAALAVVLWMFLEIGWTRLKRAVGAGRPMPPIPPKPPEVTENLVRCSECGVHVPRGRVVAGKCERCSPHPQPLSQPHTRTPGRGESARSDS